MGKNTCIRNTRGVRAKCEIKGDTHRSRQWSCGLVVLQLMYYSTDAWKNVIYLLIIIFFMGKNTCIRKAEECVRKGWKRITYIYIT